ncbi:hypothetical protein YH66_12060 [[Brevibacterium] flavum]|uniref:Uncharacterized protein n=1 Tax=[Brevibacterium] flavum TaxID=92706 RepID=A0A0F6WR72_9CORY|nr:MULTISPECIES: hypothetical protein [Corynebacterium]AKF28226.1 hypothetical protein YH66_12060 [[Brevibacterium] flavum]ANE09065.1 hypothetical protein A3654_12130 [Corynebacterium glutamicum]AST21475.1 hypothetical protein CEY17_12230 [Corynebacterium glutamicum ATCC 14067]OKX95618.1 hypothetical protein AUP71_03545 [Corynebacterium glutamicum]QJS16614.1 hypothetical protein HK412_10225 [Corynebacterium glutamicum]
MSEKEKTEVDMDFTKFLSELDKGRASQELGEKLLEVIAAVKATGKSGSLTMTISTAWDKKADMIRIGTKIAAKAPQLDRGETLFFVGNDGKPSREHPSQLALVNRNADIVDFSEPRHKA